MVRREVAVVDDVDAEDEDEDEDEATPFSILFRLVGGWDDGPPAIGSAANDTLETFFAIILWLNKPKGLDGCFTTHLHPVEARARLIHLWLIILREQKYFPPRKTPTDYT
jgi:hypothetical protein